MDPTSNFGIYRSCLKAAMWRSEGAEAGSKEEKVRFFLIVILGVYQTILYVVLGKKMCFKGDNS